MNYMKVKTIDFSKSLKKYSNEWLALEPTNMKVVAVGKLPKNVLESARKKGVDNPILTRAPQNYGTYIL